MSVKTVEQKFNDVLQDVLSGVNTKYIYYTGGYSPRVAFDTSTTNVFGQYFKSKGKVDDFGKDFQNILSNKWPKAIIQFYYRP